MNSGDVLLFKGNGPFTPFIRAAQWLRPSTRPYYAWTHCALAVNETSYIEARFSGVHLVTVNATTQARVVVPALSKDDATEVVSFAQSCVGDEYGVLSIIGIALALVTGGKFIIGMNHHFTCSSLVADSLSRSSIIWDRDPSQMTPADIARHFDVRS